MNAPDIIFLSDTKNPDEVVLKELEGIMEEKYCIVSPHSQEEEASTNLEKRHRDYHPLNLP